MKYLTGWNERGARSAVNSTVTPRNQTYGPSGMRIPPFAGRRSCVPTAMNDTNIERTANGNVRRNGGRVGIPTNVLFENICFGMLSRYAKGLVHIYGSAAKNTSPAVRRRTNTRCLNRYTKNGKAVMSKNAPVSTRVARSSPEHIPR